MSFIVRPIDLIDLNMAQKVVLNTLKVGKVPQHIAMITDGHRRYAEIHKLTRKEVYSLGFKTTSYINALCYNLGVKQVTLYMFSIENFKRSEADKSDLLDELIPTCLKEVINQSEMYNHLGIRLKIVGKIEIVPEHLKPLINEAMELTKNNDKFTINLAMAYSSSYEISNAIHAVVQKIQSKELTPMEVDSRVLQSYLLQPMDVDILLRTSGEVRLSDFLCWQIQDANIQICNKYWPEFSFWDFVGMILRYQKTIMLGK